MSFPDKALREKCWASRDDLWKCLDENKDNPEKCAKFRATYTSACPAQWVKHFDRKREYLKFKDQIQNEGSQQQQQHIERRSNLLTVPSNGSIYANSEEEHSTTTTTGTMMNNIEKNSSPNTSPNTRIFRKFQPPTYR